MSDKAIVIERTRKDLSALSGLIFFDDLITRLNLIGDLGRILPHKQRERGLSSKNKFVTGMLSFIAGADCLEDLDDLRQDSVFRHLTNGGVASTTMGKFVRAFRLKHIENLQKYLPRLALQLREKFAIRDNHFVITMDSTPHEQCGLQMEGVEFDYANHWCLNSQNAFDQYGFCYGWDLRSGGTYSSIGAELMIENIFKTIPKSCPRYFRADSAYSSLGIYNSLLVNNVNFAICLKENVWGPLLDKWEFKMEWHKTPLKFFISKKYEEINKRKRCQVASCIYPVPGLLGRSFLRVVFIRAKKDVIAKEDKRHYDYYAIVTNISEAEMKNEKIINFYRKRANGENHIKDLKNGMDFFHFPCQKLMANRAWGLMGIFAYNLMRYTAFIVSPKTGCFLKKVRRKMVFLAAEIRRGQRKFRVRFSHYFFKEVQHLSGEIHRLFRVVGFYNFPGEKQHFT